MTPQELKNSILQLAIQGRLAGQIKGEYTPNTLGFDIADPPFEIPDTWKWQVLGSCCEMYTGNSISRSEKSAKYAGLAEGYDYIATKDVSFEQKIEYDNGVRIPFDSTFKRAYKDSVLMCIEGGSAGRKIGILDRDVCFGNKLCMFRADKVLNTFLFHYLQSAEFKKLFSENMTGIIGGVSIKKLKDILMPIPPLAEQKRIVAKIEELLPYIDRYEKAWSKLEDFNKRFPVDMQKSILQMAIQGKLVEQRPEEGTGEELFQQIQAEKQRLIKTGTIKKEKSLPEISEDEKPFDIPESWKWVRIGQIFSLQAGKNITASEIYEESSPEHSFLCYGGNGVRGYVRLYNRSGHYALIGRQGALCGNINHANGEFYATEHAVVVDHFQLCDALWSGYFLQALNLNQYATATAQPGLAVSNIVKVLIPLPPLAEQKRIVAMLEEILPLCEKLITLI